MFFCSCSSGLDSREPDIINYSDFKIPSSTPISVIYRACLNSIATRADIIKFLSYNIFQSGTRIKSIYSHATLIL